MSISTAPLRAGLAVVTLAALAATGTTAPPDSGAEKSDLRADAPADVRSAPTASSSAAAGREAPLAREGGAARVPEAAGSPGRGLVLEGPPVQDAAPRPDGYYDFFFTRAVYGGGGFWGRPSWAIDYPKADRQFLVVLAETLDLLHVPRRENAVRLDDPELRRFPFLYMLEVGGMRLSEDEVEGLRGYLEAGGFLVVDDFWGDYEWRNFEREMRRVFPGRTIEDLPMDHPIFSTFYEIDELLQVPSVGNARRGRTSECGACRPQARGIFDDEGRLMVVINWNTDLGDAWEWSERPEYPFEYSNFAYKMAVNFIIYAMTR